MPRAASELTPPPARRSRARRLAIRIFLVALLPTLVAIWTVPWFVTQDGPAHVYNAHIIAESLRPGSPFQDVYEVRWDPLPNWIGHLTLVGLLEVLPPRMADRVVMTLTLVGFALAVAWLRWRVAGWSGMPVAAAFAVLLAINAPWLFGFTSFLLGACLFPVTLGVWWGGRERMGIGRAVALAVLLVLGYFCHLVSLGLTVVGMLVLTLFTPGPARTRRTGWTLASLAPLVYLGVVYRGLMREGGSLAPEWDNLKTPWSLSSWGSQLGWVDPLSLGSKVILPFLSLRSRWCGVLAPIVWFSIALGLLVFGTLLRRSAGRQADAPGPKVTRRGWAILSALLLLGGLCGPDSLGPGHGNYLPQRVFLLGLVAILPFLNLDPRRWIVRSAATALTVALVMQSAFVWDYALYANRVAGDVARAKPFVGHNNRIGTLLVGIRGLYRSNPLLHIDSELGVGTGNVIWGNYEATHYYFPVRVRNAAHHPPGAEFEAVAILDGPRNAPERRQRWAELVGRYHSQCDYLVVWGSDPVLDAMNDRWFQPRVSYGEVRVFQHRKR